MKGKVLKMLLTLILPVISCFALGIFLAEGFSFGYASALMQNGGFSFVHSDTTMKIETGTTISNFTAVNGGGVYVSSGGTLVMNGGTFSNNTASSGSGHNIYNAGVFTMNGGVVGTSQGTQTGFGIFNTGTMNLFGGTIYDDIYSENSINMKMNAHVEGTITLGESATITVEDYNGTTPNYSIVLSSSRTNATVLTFKGSTTTPDLSKIAILGDLSSIKLKAEQSETDETFWTVKLVCTLTLNKSSGISSVSGGGTYDYGTSVEIKFFLATGYYSGYWLGDDGSYTYSQTKTITIKGNTTFTACANPNSYTVKYDKNDEYASGSTADSKHTFNKAGTLTSNGFKNNGYIFVGWSTEPGINTTVKFPYSYASADRVGSGTYSNLVKDGASVTNLTSTSSGTITLYAQWFRENLEITLESVVVENNGLTVYNGRSDGTRTISYHYETKKFYINNMEKTTITIPTSEIPGDIFKGFWTGSGGTGTCYIDSSGNIDVEGLSNYIEKYDFSSLTLYHKWGSYTITFDMSNGGTCFVHQKQSYNITVGELPTPVRSGYAFTGWYTLEGTEVTKGSSLTEDITVYAHWQEMNSFFGDGNDENYKYVYWGFYPQSKQYSTVGNFEKEGLADGNNCYYKGSDGNYYYLDGGTYYLYEPILWKVGKNSRSNNSSYFIEYAMTPVSILDVHDFSDDLSTQNNWLIDYFVVKILSLGEGGDDIILDWSYCCEFDTTWVDSTMVGNNSFPGFNFPRTPTEYALAKTPPDSNNAYSWWVVSGFAGNGTESSGIISGRYEDSSSVITSVEKSTKYGIVPFIAVSLNHCLKCEQTTTYSYTHDATNHYTTATTTCSVCKKNFGATTTAYYNPYTTTWGDEYTSISDTQHKRSGTKKCSICSYSSSVTETTSHTEVTTKGTTAEYYDDQKHYYVDTVTCSDCSWAGRTETRYESHFINNNTKKCVCGYSDLFAHFTTMLFQSSNNYHCDDDDCLSQAVLCQDVLIDDKKKYSSEVVLEEKRYTNDVVQFPRIVG